MKFIEIKVTSTQLMRAEKLYDFSSLHNSITKGDSQMYGAIGEVVAMDYLIASGVPTEYVGCKDYDLMCDCVSIDVKTIRVNVPPTENHNANISAFNTRQNTFMYLWVYVKEDMSTAWLVGWLDKESFFEEAVLNHEGDEDGGGWVFKSDTYSLKVKNLIDTDSLISNLKQINMSLTKQQFEANREDLGTEYQPTPMIRLESNLWTALAGFQQEVPVIHKATQGYGYTYADLTKIIQVINPILARHGLGYTQPLMGTAIKTIVFHIETGQTLESIVEIPQGVALKGMNDFQVLGSAISYLRRYSLASILTLITDADLDASGEQTKKSTPAPPAPPADRNLKEGAKVTPPPIAEKDFLKLCGAINAKKVHNGEVIDEAWAVKMYALTKEQLSTIQMINK
jgi:hypothetical protein